MWHLEIGDVYIIILLLIVNKCYFNTYYTYFLTYDIVFDLFGVEYLINVNSDVTFVIHAAIIFVAIN